MTAETPVPIRQVDGLAAAALRLVDDGRGAAAVALLQGAGDAATTDAWEGLADRLWQRAEYPEAELAYSAVLARHPRHDVAVVRMSMYFQWRQDLPGARAFLRGDGTTPLTGPVAARLGHLLLHEGDHVNAEAMLRFAIGQPGAPASAWRDLSETLNLSGRRADAMAIARDAFALMPSDPEIQAWLGHLLLEVGEAERAAGHLGAALASGAAPPFARLRYAEALFRTKQIAACIAEARRALDDRSLAPASRALAGYLLIQCGESTEGEALMAEAIAAEPLSPGLRLLRSAAFFDCGRKAEAVMAARDGADALPDSLEILDRYGHLLLITEDVATALGVFERALAIKPDHLNSWLGLCEAARLCKQFKQAIAAFRKLNELGADAQTIRDQRYRLFGEMT